MRVFLLAGVLAANSTSHARFDFVDGRISGNVDGILSASQRPTQNTFAIHPAGHDDRRRDSGNEPRGVGMVEVKPKVKKVYTWTCQYCGADFETENLQQRYCRPSHKQRAYELRREQRAEIPVDAEIE